MADQDSKPWEYDEPTDWQATILEHIITINHELGDVVRDLAWIKKVIKILIVIVALLALTQGDKVLDVLKSALDLLT